MHEWIVLTRLGEDHLMRWGTLNGCGTCNLPGQLEGAAIGPMMVLRPWSATLVAHLGSEGYPERPFLPEVV